MTGDSSPYEQSGVVLTLEVNAGEADRLVDDLRARWQQEPVQYLRPHQATAWVELHFSGELEAELARATLTGDTAIRTAVVRPFVPADWQAVFRRQFEIQPIGRRLRICPEWERDRVAEDDRVNLWIDPGLSFGTGDHFTTTFCLEMLDQVWLNSPPVSVLDAGTGSGLLAIAAAALGCPKVVAFDADEAVLPYTRANLQRNGVADRIELLHLDVNQAVFAERFEVTCANLYGGLLLECAPILVRATERTLIVSGIRDIEVDAVADTFVQAGAVERARDCDNEWAGLLLDVARG